VSKLSCKHKDLSQVIVVNGIEVLRDPSVPYNKKAMKHNLITSDSSRKHKRCTSDSSSKHSNLTSESSRKDSEITSESTRKQTGITAKSRTNHLRNLSVSSREHCQSSRRHRSRPLRKGRCRRVRNSRLSSKQLVGCLSSNQKSIVTRSGNLASFQQSSANHSRRSSEANSANQSSKLSSLSSSSSCAKTSAVSGTKMEYSVQDYRPLVVDATNISKSKGTKTSSVCPLLDSIMDETSECVETVRELDDYILMVTGRKRRHADSSASRTVKAKVGDTFATCIHKQKSSRREDTAAAHEHKQKSSRHKDTLVTGVHKQKYSHHQDTPGATQRQQKCLQRNETPSTCKNKQKCSQNDDDTSSVISLGSDDEDDDEVEIIDSDPEPQSGRSGITNVVTDTLHKRNPETVVIDLCSPSVNSEYPALTQKYMDRVDKKMSSREYTRIERPFKEYVSVLGDGFRTSRNIPHDVPSVSDHRTYGFLPFPSPAPASSVCDSVLNSGVEKMQDCEVVFIPSDKGCDTMNSATVCGSSLQKLCLTDVRRRLQAIDNKMDQTSVPSSSAYGNNLYNPHPDTVRMGLRPIVIDGSNVAMG